MERPHALLNAGPTTTRLLIKRGRDQILRAVLPAATVPAGPHRHAAPALLEAVALWCQAPVHVVLCAEDLEFLLRLGLVDGLYEPIDTLHYTVEVRGRDRDRRRPRRIKGVGSFVDIRQLVLGGGR